MLADKGCSVLCNAENHVTGAGLTPWMKELAQGARQEGPFRASAGALQRSSEWVRLEAPTTRGSSSRLAAAPKHAWLANASPKIGGQAQKPVARSPFLGARAKATDCCGIQPHMWPEPPSEAPARSPKLSNALGWWMQAQKSGGGPRTRMPGRVARPKYSLIAA
jgi:hypothetical protein